MANVTRGVAFVVALAFFLSAGATVAATGLWTPTSVHGVVVYLLDGKWEEVTRGQDLAQAKLRTLRSGRVSLTGPSVTLEVGPNSALQLTMKADGSGGTVEQYLGSLNVAAQKTNAGLIVRAGKVTLSGITGEVLVLVASSSTSITVASGTAAVTGPGGEKQVLDTGIYAADAGGLVTEQLADTSISTALIDAPAGQTPTSGDGSSTTSATAPGNGAGNANGSGAGSGNGSGSGAGRGNGSGNGAGNGNGGGAGNGKSAADDNGNAAGNGHGKNP